MKYATESWTTTAELVSELEAPGTIIGSIIGTPVYASVTIPAVGSQDPIFAAILAVISLGFFLPGASGWRAARSSTWSVPTLMFPPSTQLISRREGPDG